MPAPPRRLISPRVQAAIAGLVAAVLVIAGFQTGRYTVDAAAVANNTAVPSQPPSEAVSRKDALVERQQDRITIRDIATVPFSELYDILKTATPEQLMAWADDLEQMPRGPRQRAGVNAYYKSLVQVNHRVAIEAVLHAKNLIARDVAIDAMLKGAPESIWADLAEMTTRLSYPGRGFAQDNLIPNWSRVDPVAASRFVEKHRSTLGVTVFSGEESDRAVSLLSNWGEIDPSAARKWLEAEADRQTPETFRAFLTSWGRVDRAAAIDYAIANDARPNFRAAINELVHDCVRFAKTDATKLILLLPSDQAKAALKNVADVTNPHESGPNIERPPNYQQPADQVARWMITLPVELWNDSIGVVANGWLSQDADAAKAWLNQLRPDLRDAAIGSACRAASLNWWQPKTVIELGFTISDPQLRESALRELVRGYTSKREDALGIINEFSVSEEQKAYLHRLVTEDANGR
jgi:hypothetical protein